MANINPTILAEIDQREKAYQLAPNTGTRCELLKAYGSAAQATSDQTTVLSWLKKAYLLAESGAQTEPCFYSYWDAAVTAINYAQAALSYGYLTDARKYFKCAIVYLEAIRDKKLESPVPGCDPTALLCDAYRQYTAISDL